MKKLIISLGLLTAIGIAGSVFMIKHVVNQPLAIAGKPHDLDVRPGSSLTKVAGVLATDGVLEWPRAFVLYARWQGLADHIQAGEYIIQPGTTASDLLGQLVEGRVRLHTLTVIEGWTFKDFLNALASESALNQTLANLTVEQVMERLGKPGQHPEGLFFPDTYRFPKGTDDSTILVQANKLLEEKLASAWDGRAVGLPFNSDYDALILASIVEKETALESERAKVAGVFVNRLRKRMRLQTDPTVIYGLGETFDGDIRRGDLERDNPYNTYTRNGLPPTPIALAGSASINAVMQPDETNALYFVATGDSDGSHYFSNSLEEHNAAVLRYLRRRQEQQRKGE